MGSPKVPEMNRNPKVRGCVRVKVKEFIETGDPPIGWVLGLHYWNRSLKGPLPCEMKIRKTLLLNLEISPEIQESLTSLRVISRKTHLQTNEYICHLWECGPNSQYPSVTTMSRWKINKKPVLGYSRILWKQTQNCQ